MKSGRKQRKITKCSGCLGLSEPNLWGTIKVFGGVLWIARGGCSSDAIAKISIYLRISAEHISPREKLLICSELHTVSSPALMKGHQPLTRFCWNMDILFSSLAAMTMPRSQLLAVFAARGNPFRFNSRVPKERSNVTTLRDQTDMMAFKQQLPDEIHGAMQQLGHKFQSWGSLYTVSHSFVLPWHRLICVPNYSLSKKCVSLQCDASKTSKSCVSDTTLYIPVQNTGLARPQVKFSQLYHILTQEIICRESFKVPHLKHQLSRYFALCLFQGKYVFSFTNHHLFLCWEIVEREHKAPVEVALSCQGVVMYVCLLLVLFQTL